MLVVVVGPDDLDELNVGDMEEVVLVVINLGNDDSQYSGIKAFFFFEKIIHH